MAEENSPVVLTVKDSATAGLVVEWLAGHGIEAESVPVAPQTTTEVLTGLTEMAPAAGVEVHAKDPAKAEEARQLLAKEANAVKELQERRANRTGTVEATCEDCGKTSRWPAASMGLTEVCPHCAGYMDIPDPDDDWGDFDVGEDEEEEEDEDSDASDDKK